MIAAPVAVTACVNPGPDVTSATEELIEVWLPDGEVTMRRERGWLWQSRVSDVSDSRLEGTWYNGADGDGYTLPGGAEVSVGTETHRIENDAGAWQGSKVTVGLPEGMFPEGAIGENYIQVLIGEGAYEGLTWVGTILMGQPCPNTKGYIIEGPVGAPPGADDRPVAGPPPRRRAQPKGRAPCPIWPRGRCPRPTTDTTRRWLHAATAGGCR